MENWTSLQTRYLGGADRPRLQSAAHSRTRAAADGRRIRARRDGLVAHGRGDFDRQIQEGRAGRVTELKASVTHADNPHNDIVVDAVDAVAKEVGVKPGQVAVAWVKAKGALPVIGTRTYGNSLTTSAPLKGPMPCQRALRGLGTVLAASVSVFLRRAAALE